MPRPDPLVFDADQQRPALACARAGRARIAWAILVALSLVAPFTIKRHIGESVRTAAGAAAGVALLLGLWGVSSPTRRVPDTRAGRNVCLLAAGLLLANLATKELSPFLGLVPRRPPTLLAIECLAVMAALLALAKLRRWDSWSCTIVLVGAVAATRILVWRMSPFKGLSGDMLWNTNRALDALRAGRFPYLDTHPQMPYLPGTLLAYWLPHRLGCDLRLTNFLLEIATVLVALGRPGSHRMATALPLFLLHPTWTYLGVNTQYAPSVFAVVVLARCLSSADWRAQGVALGLALGTNQMFLALAPAIACWWIATDRRRGLGAMALCALIFVAIIAPFLIWNPEQFLRVAYLVRPGVRAAVLQGALTMWPWLAAGGKSAGTASSAAVVMLACAAAWRVRSGSQLLPVLAVTLGAALLVQPASFTHYFLPAIALATMIPEVVAGHSGVVPHQRPRSFRQPISCSLAPPATPA